MKAILGLYWLAPVVAIACAPVNSFSPAGPQRFGPTEGDVLVLEEPPARPYVVIGYAECRGGSVSDAMPHLLKQARANGGNAILKVESTGIAYGVSTYRVAVIRFTDE